MARNICLFDLFPVELLYTLFTYFWAHEIFYSFSDINDHINGVVLTYSSHRINFQSILKCHFDILCRLIRPDQVISLTLSDDNDTPDQSKLFFSYFNIEQFIRLRSFTLIDIEINSLQSILSKLNKLNQLRSLSIHCDNIVKQRYSQRSINNVHATNQINYYQPMIPIEVLLQMNRLTFGVGINFDGSIIFVHLRYLTIARSTVKNLQMIFSQMPQLILLNICLEGDVSNIGHISTFSPLRWLTLRIIDSPITMDRMESFLSNLPHLTHFELDIKGQIDLADGYQWQMLSEGFITFNFKLNVELRRVDPILDSFRTSFWLSKKCWYVAYDNKCLFTVPHFASTNVDVPYYPPKSSTILDDTVFYNHIKNVTIFEPRHATLHRFHHLKELHVRCSISPKFFLAEVNLSQIHHLTLSSLDNIQSFILHLNAMPRLCKLSLNGYLTADFIEHLRDCRTEQIRTLEIDTLTKNISYILEGLIRLFPRIERLRISTIQLRKDMIRLIDGFQHLSIGSFIIKSSFTKKDQDWFLKPELSIRGVQRLQSGTFTCRYHRLSIGNSSCEVHVWIGEQSRQHWWIENLPPRRGYFWYRSMHILSDYLNIDIIQSIRCYFDLYEFKRSLKPYLHCLVNCFCVLLNVISVVCQFIGLLSLIHITVEGF